MFRVKHAKPWGAKRLNIHFLQELFREKPWYQGFLHSHAHSGQEQRPPASWTPQLPSWIWADFAD